MQIIRPDPKGHVTFEQQTNEQVDPNDTQASERRNLIAALFARLFRAHPRG